MSNQTDQSSHQAANPAPAAVQAMIDALASVGADAFDVTWTNLQGQKVSFRRGLLRADLRRWLPRMLAWAASQQLNLIVRPNSRDTVLVQLDDLRQDALDRLRSVAFRGLETSPGNYQAWVALPAAESDQDFARRLRKGTGAYANASGAVRIAGSINFKQKYAPNFPRVQLTHTAPGLIPSRAQLESLGVVAAPEAAAPAETADLRATVITARPTRREPRAWPDYQRCLDGAPPNGDGTGSDRSKADYFWCLLAIQRGWGIDETAERLMELSDKARENGHDYALRTARKAATLPAVDSRRSPREHRDGGNRYEIPSGCESRGYSGPGEC